MALSQEQFERLKALNSKYGGVAKLPEETQDAGYKPFGSVVSAVKDFGSNIKTAFEKRTEAGAIEGEKAIQGETSLGQGALRMFGQGAGAVGDVGFELLKLATPKFVEDIASKGMEAVAGTQPVQDAFTKYQTWKSENPDTAKDLEAVGNILSIIPVGKGAQVGIKGVEKAVATLPDIAQATSKRLGTAIDERRLVKIAQEKQLVDEAVGKIVQGKPQDIERAKRALSSIDTTDVKSYKDLNSAIENKTEALMRTMDEYLEKQTGSLKPQDVAKVTKVGEQQVTQNFVKDALTQLDEMYGAIKDAPEQLRIQQLKTKFETEGLTRKELNDIARAYGSEFGSKAFSKTGDPLTSVNAQAFENTRKGVKEAVRSTIPDDVPKQIDSQISDLIKTKELTTKMETKVNALWQKVAKRGLAERLARGTADFVDTITLKTLSGFMARMLPSNVGLKTMNSIDLEKQLTKNLKVIEQAMNAKDDADMISILMKSVKENVDEPTMGMSLKDVSKKRIQSLAKNMSGEDYVKLENYIQKTGMGEQVTIQEMEDVYSILEGMGTKPLKRTEESIETTIKNLLGDYEEGMTKVPVQSIK